MNLETRVLNPYDNWISHGFYPQEFYMENYMDIAWEHIEAFLTIIVAVLGKLFSPLEVFGPAIVIFVLSFLVVCLTKFLSKVYVTRRYLKLKKAFEHWRKIRETALKHPDREKGKTLAKNIDQAQLNKAYYDYFFEGLLKNLITTVLPILLMAAYITRVYTPQTLLTRFGDKWVLSLSFGTSPVNFSSLFWFVVCLILSFILFTLFKNVLKIW